MQNQALLGEITWRNFQFSSSRLLMSYPGIFGIDLLFAKYQILSKSMRNFILPPNKISWKHTFVALFRREKVASRIGSKRNSLDKQSVQTLAQVPIFLQKNILNLFKILKINLLLNIFFKFQDLAAECAKAYALMESSLSKLSSELGVTPFGLAPKSKVGIKKYFIILDWEFVKVWGESPMH